MNGLTGAFPAPPIDGPARKFPKGFYLVVGEKRTIATRHDTLLEAQRELHRFVQRAPIGTLVYIAEIIPREYETLTEWVAL